MGLQPSVILGRFTELSSAVRRYSCRQLPYVTLDEMLIDELHKANVVCPTQRLIP